MASDGSIIIDTALDNDGFEDGADKIERAIKSLEQTVKTIGDNMMQSFAQLSPAVKAIATETSQAYAEMVRSGDDVAKANDRMKSAQTAAANSVRTASNAFGGESKAAYDAAKALDTASEKVETIGNSQAPANFTKSIRSAESEANKLSNRLTRMGDALAMGLKTDTQMQRFVLNLSHAEDAVQLLQQRIRTLQNQKIPTEDYQRITNEVKKAESALFRLYDKQDQLSSDDSVSEISSEWIRLQKQIERAEIKLNQYESTKAKLEQSGNAFVSGSDTAEVANLSAKLQTLQQQVSSYKQAASGFDGISAPAAKSSSAVGTLYQAMQKATSTAGGLIKQFAKMALSKVANGFKSVVQRVKEFVTHGKSANLTANSITKSLLRLKNMLISRVKESLITQIFNQAKESLKSLALFSAEFDKAMSNITNSSKMLSANMSVSLGNLVNAVEPALTSIINLVSKAFTYLNSFFAMLSGKNTVIVAKKQTASYADSLKDTSDSANDTADAVEELNNELYGFDEITKQTAEDATSLDTSTGTSTTPNDGSDLFQEVAIQAVVPDQVKKYFDSLKAAIKSGDWYSAGSTIANGLNTAIAVADKYINTTLTPKMVSWVASATSALNGFIDNFNWRGLGTLISSGLNGILAAFDTFFINFHAREFGSGIANTINGFFDGVSWELLGKTVGDGLNSILSFFIGFSETLNLGTIGTSIATAINSLFSTINWTYVGAFVSNGLNGISDLLYGFASTVQWSTIATDIATGFNTAIKGWEPEKTARAIMSVINGAISFLTTILSEIDWTETVTKLLDFLKSAIEEFDWANAGDFLSALVSAVFAIVNTLLDYDWGELITSLGEGIGGMLASIDWAELAVILLDLVKNMLYNALTFPLSVVQFITSILSGFFKSIGCDGIAGFFEGISEKIKNIKQWLKEHFCSPVVDWVKKLFGIHSPSTVFAGIGGNLMAGLKNGVSDKIESVKQKFSEVKDKVVSTFNNVKDKLKEKFSDAFEGVKTTWSNAQSHFSSVKDNVVSAFSNIKDDLKGKFESAWSAVKEIDWGNLGTNILDGVVDGMSNFGEKVSTWGSNFLNGVKNFFDINSPSRVFRDEIGYYLGTGLAEGLDNAQTSVMRSVSTLAENITDGLQSINTDISPTLNMPDTSALKNIARTYGAPSILNAMPQHTKVKIARGETINQNSTTETQMDTVLSKLDALISAIGGDDTGDGSSRTNPQFVIYLDGREATKSIVKQVNNTIRATGKSPFLA